MKSATLLNNVIDFTNNQQEISDINTLFGLLSLKKLSRKQEVDKLVSFLENLSQKDNENNELVLALFNNNEKKLEQLKKKSIVSEGTWRVLEASLNY